MSDDAYSAVTDIPELRLLKEFEDGLEGERYTDFVDCFGLGVHNALREWLAAKPPTRTWSG